VYAASNDKLTFSLSSTWTFASAWVYNTRNTFNTKNMSSVVREMMHFLKNAFRSPNFKNCQMEKRWEVPRSIPQDHCLCIPKWNL